jgi:hypothetical protein
METLGNLGEFAYVISVPRESTPDVQAHYFSEARPFYLLMAAFLTLSVVSRPSLDLAASIESQAAPAILLIRMLVISIFLVLAYTKNRVVHGVPLSVLIAIAIAGSGTLVPRL